MSKAFDTWIDTFIDEKGISLDKEIIVEGDSIFGDNLMSVAVVVEGMKNTTLSEQADIKHILVRIDFHNADVFNYLKHLATYMARQQGL